MPDLDDELTGLKDSLRQSVYQPELDTVVARSRQRSSRRRRQLGAVAAVLVVGATIPLLRTALRPAPDDAVRSAGPVSTTTVPVDPPTTDHRVSAPFIYDIAFADDRHGYALRGTCGPENNAECTSELLAFDGGNWVTRKLPAQLGHTIGSVSGQVVVLGPDKLLVGEVSARGGPRFWSTDAGRTWQQTPGTDDELVDAIPDGAPLRFFCQDQNECAAKLVVIRPDNGHIATLRTPPALRDARPAVEALVAGAWWVSGKNSAGQLELAASRDAGRSWTGATLPNTPADAFWVSVTAKGMTLYATVTGQLSAVKNGLLGIHRSTDGGKHWEQVWQAGPEREPRSISGVAIAAEDGTLTITTELGHPYVSTDGGKTFTPANRGKNGYVRLTTSGYLVYSAMMNPSTYYLSKDGVNWQEIIIR